MIDLGRLSDGMYFRSDEVKEYIFNERLLYLGISLSKTCVEKS